MVVPAHKCIQEKPIGQLIGEVKNNPRIHIPIIGNGDVTSVSDAQEHFNRYGVDAIMIGRATFGCPWLFSETAEVGINQLTLDDKIDVLEEMLRINVDKIDSIGVYYILADILQRRPFLKVFPTSNKRVLQCLKQTKWTNSSVY